MAIDITPKSKKKPLKINYDGTQYVLPGRAPLELVTAQGAVPRPKVMAGAQKEDYTRGVGVAVLAAFVEHVLPLDFQAALDIDDIGAVFEAWSEHSGWGKSKSSDD